MRVLNILGVEKSLESNEIVSEETSGLSRTRLTLLEGASLIVGTNIGAGILSLAFGSRHAGWPILLFWIIVTGALTTVMLLYVAETTLMNNKYLNLSSL